MPYWGFFHKCWFGDTIRSDQPPDKVPSLRCCTVSSYSSEAAVGSFLWVSASAVSGPL